MPEQKTKKSNTGVWITLIIVVLFVIGGYYYFFVYKAGAGTQEIPTPSITGVIYDIKMLEFTFLPKTLTINIGDAVNWTNGDQVQSDIVSNTGAFVSSNLTKGESYLYVFTAAGTYDYHSSLHPTMKGKIIVE